MLNEEREEQRMMMTMSELVVVLRDARGMREERALRVSARFDDQERVSVSISSFDFRECIPIKREFFLLTIFCSFSLTGGRQKSCFMRGETKRSRLVQTTFFTQY
jgi:hypothetical protein